jgi:putative tryptophan/tyrosine transport system substrate-binding protein
MKRIWIDSLNVTLKSALRNLKFAILLGAMLFALCLPASAQHAHIPRIGYLAGGGSSLPQPFVQRLRDLGYVEGKNIAFEYRTTEGQSRRYPDLAAELVRLKVDIMVAEGSRASLFAKKLAAQSLSS